MARKNLKRTLALSALMTFLITGSVWAANDGVTIANITINGKTESDYKVPADTTSGSTIYKIGSASDEILITDEVKDTSTVLVDVNENANLVVEGQNIMIRCVDDDKDNNIVYGIGEGHGILINDGEVRIGQDGKTDSFKIEAGNALSIKNSQEGEATGKAFIDAKEIVLNSNEWGNGEFEGGFAISADNGTTEVKIGSQGYTDTLASNSFYGLTMSDAGTLTINVNSEINVNTSDDAKNYSLIGVSTNLIPVLKTDDIDVLNGGTTKVEIGSSQTASVNIFGNAYGLIASGTAKGGSEVNVTGQQIDISNGKGWSAFYYAANHMVDIESGDEDDYISEENLAVYDAFPSAAVYVAQKSPLMALFGEGDYGKTDGAAPSKVTITGDTNISTGKDTAGVSQILCKLHLVAKPNIIIGGDSSLADGAP